MKKEFGKWLMDIAKVSNDSCYIVIYYYRYG